MHHMFFFQPIPLVLLFMLKGQKGSHPLRITLPAIGKNRFFSKFWTTSDWKWSPSWTKSWSKYHIIIRRIRQTLKPFYRKFHPKRHLNSSSIQGTSLWTKEMWSILSSKDGCANKLFFSKHTRTLPPDETFIRSLYTRHFKDWKTCFHWTNWDLVIQKP